MHAAAGDPHRLAIVDALGVSDLAPSGCARWSGSNRIWSPHHLDVLVDAGLIGRTRLHGDRRWYLR